jgi:hypothetical protein
VLDIKISESVTDRIIKAWREFHYSLSCEEILICSYEAAKFGGKPTRRAIQDHIRKLKTEASTVATPKSNASAGGVQRTALSTPSKTARSTARKNTGTGSGRKRKTFDDSDDDDEEYNVGRKEVNDLTASPTPETPRKRRAASKRVSELIKKMYETETDDEDEDIQDPDSEISKVGSDGDEGYVEAEEESVEDAGNLSAGVVEEAMNDSKMPVEEDIGDIIHVKNEPELEL